MPSHAQGAVPVDASTVVDPGDHPRPGATSSTDRGDPHGKDHRRPACEALVAAYGGDTYRLLTDLAGRAPTVSHRSGPPRHPIRR